LDYSLTLFQISRDKQMPQFWQLCLIQAAKLLAISHFLALLTPLRRSDLTWLTQWTNLGSRVDQWDLDMSLTLRFRVITIWMEPHKRYTLLNTSCYFKTSTKISLNFRKEFKSKVPKTVWCRTIFFLAPSWIIQLDSEHR
jgi:hypothetical protein